MIYKEKVPLKIFKMWIFWIFGFSAGTFIAPMGGTVGVPRCHSLRLYMRYDKKMKSENFPKTIIFFRWKIFSKDFEKSKISKSHFFEIFRKIENFKKSTFSKKWLFKIYNFSKSFEKYFHWKNKSFRKICTFYFFYRISCITSSSGIAELPLCRPWARLTSPPKIRKSRKFIFLKIFGVTFSL